MQGVALGLGMVGGECFLKKEKCVGMCPVIDGMHTNIFIIIIIIIFPVLTRKSKYDQVNVYAYLPNICKENLT